VEQPDTNKIGESTIPNSSTDFFPREPQAPQVSLSAASAVIPTSSLLEIASSARLSQAKQQNHEYVQSSWTDKPKAAIDLDLTDSPLKAKKQSPIALTENQRARQLALHSMLKEYRPMLDAEQEDSELLVGKHLRKQDNLAKKAVDEFLAQLIGDSSSAEI
jgi:hypothetical protein